MTGTVDVFHAIQKMSNVLALYLYTITAYQGHFMVHCINMFFLEKLNGAEMSSQ